MVYTTFDVAQDGLGDALRGAHALGIAGLNVTAPHKTAVMEHLSHLDQTAEIAGAVNLLKYAKNGYNGYNTDVYGIMGADIIHPQHKTATILGAGGVAKAAIIALNQLGCKDITIIKRGEIHKIENARGHIFIQATSATPDELLNIAPPSKLENFDIIFDMNYPAKNPWLDSFKSEIKTFDGIRMLVHQAIKAFEILWNTDVPRGLARKIIDQIYKERVL